AAGSLLDDKLTLASVLAAHPQTRREAVQLLKDLDTDHVTLEQHLLLSTLYEETRDWVKGRESFNALAARSLAAPVPLYRYVVLSATALLRHGNVSDAAAWAEK